MGLYHALKQPTRASNRVARLAAAFSSTCECQHESLSLRMTACRLHLGQVGRAYDAIEPVAERAGQAKAHLLPVTRRRAGRRSCQRFPVAWHQQEAHVVCIFVVLYGS